MPREGISSDRMNGLRLSGRHIRLHQKFPDHRNLRQVPIYRVLAADRINISFLLADCLGSVKQIICLVEPEMLTRLDEELTIKDGMSGNQDLSASACLVSVFPHRYNPASVGITLQALTRNDVGWHMMATSGSMLSFGIDYVYRKKAADVISHSIGLPASHGPICPGQGYDPIARSLKTAPETVARYVESRIGTYGIRVKKGLVLCTLRMSPDALGKWACAIAEKGFIFHYASAVCGNDPKDVFLAMVLDRKNDCPEDNMESCLPEFGGSGSIELYENVHMISFHGPHFGDRYGIADKALSGLSGAGISVLLAGCVGATVSIVLPSGTSEIAIETLTEKFDFP